MQVKNIKTPLLSVMTLWAQEEKIYILTTYWNIL
jgi:hypothetical protein